MDSLTQVVLGSAVGYAVLGNKIGRKAALWGAALGTLPDLDVFIPYGGRHLLIIAVLAIRLLCTY